MKTAGIVAFAFGVPRTIEPNLRIAEIASRKARALGSRVYTQLDICVDNDVSVEYTEEEPGCPPPTLRIARGAIGWAKKYRLTEMWVVAAKPHLFRAMRDLEEAIREVGAHIEIHACREIEEYPVDSWFCANSTQEWVRSRDAWDKRENILKHMPFFIYKRVAG